jgi:hypothetical protein
MREKLSVGDLVTFKMAVLDKTFFVHEFYISGVVSGVMDSYYIVVYVSLISGELCKKAFERDSLSKYIAI